MTTADIIAILVYRRGTTMWMCVGLARLPGRACHRQRAFTRQEDRALEVAVWGGGGGGGGGGEGRASRVVKEEVPRGRYKVRAPSGRRITERRQIQGTDVTVRSIYQSVEHF